MIVEIGALLVAFAAGIALGVSYFGTMWWVVRRLPRVERPMLWLGLSAALRLAAVLPAFYFVMDGGLERLGACLLGFLAARFLLTRWARVRAASGALRA